MNFQQGPFSLCLLRWYELLLATQLLCQVLSARAWLLLRLWGSTDGFANICNYTSYTDTHTYSFLGIYIIVYIDIHTRISLHTYTHIFLASLLLRFFLLLVALETYFIVGGECFAPHLTFACQKWVPQVVKIWGRAITRSTLLHCCVFWWHRA